MDEERRSDVFKVIAKACTSEWPGIIWSGTNVSDMRAMLGAARKYLADSFAWEQPFAHKPFHDFEDFERELKWRIAGDNAFAIVGISKPWKHWKAREKERDFIGREAYETFTQRSRDDFAGLRREIQASLTEVSAAREAAFTVLANSSGELAKIYDSRFGRIESAQAKMFGGLLFAATILPLITGIMVYMLSGKSL